MDSLSSIYTRQRNVDQSWFKPTWHNHVRHHWTIVANPTQLSANYCLTLFTYILFLLLEYICFSTFLCSLCLSLVSIITNWRRNEHSLSLKAIDDAEQTHHNFCFRRTTHNTPINNWHQWFSFWLVDVKSFKTNKVFLFK